MRTGILAAALVASGLGMAAPNSNNTSLLDPTWVLADFNGDGQPNFASARLTHHDGREFAHVVSVNLGSVQTSFRFRSPTANIELSARDIDGDEDCDIIILEARSRRPIGVWLNDGTGSFQEGDLSRFQKSLNSVSGPAFSVRSGYQGLPEIGEQRVPAGAPAIVRLNREPDLECLVSQTDSLSSVIRGSDLRLRAPPLS